jgi:lipopolysaccharide heptosyltransferase II
MEKKFENIVILRTDRIGEVLLSSAVVDAIKDRHHDARISFVTSEYSSPLLENRSDIERVLTADTMTKGGCFSRAISLARELRSGGYDTAIVLNPHKMLHLACFLAGIPRRIGYDRKWGFFLTDKFRDDRNRGDRHEIECTVELLERAGIGVGRPQLRLELDKNAEEKVKELLSEKGITGERPLVLIHPGSSNPAKIWPGENYAEIIRRIKKDLGCDIAVLGSKEEGALAGKIIRESEVGAIDLTGALDLKELAAVLKRSALFIGNDTGPMHMAAALKVPVIAIFGRNIPGVSPMRWRPWGDGHMVFHEDPGCDPCYDTECPYDYKCLRSVTADIVFKTAKKILASKARAQNSDS